TYWAKLLDFPRAIALSLVLAMDRMVHLLKPNSNRASGVASNSTTTTNRMPPARKTSPVLIANVTTVMMSIIMVGVNLVITYRNVAGEPTEINIDAVCL